MKEVSTFLTLIAILLVMSLLGLSRSTLPVR
jgi:hypothetical protein